MGNKVKINVDFFTMLDLNESNKIESFEHGQKMTIFSNQITTISAEIG